MARPKLQTKRGNPVAEWTAKPAELKKLLAAPKPPTARIRTIPLPVSKADLRILPTTFALRELLRPEHWWPQYFCKPRYRVRKNQKNLTPVEWQRFIHAIEALAESGMPSPTYSEFVNIHMTAMDTHTGHAWGAHTMAGHDGRNFLAWHREYLAKIEAQLVTINPLVTIPYWDWVTDRSAIPAALTDQGDIADWGITRGASFNGNSLASAAELNTLLADPVFNTFQSTLEAAPFHNRLHVLVGGTMASSASPADPLFWLHHAFIDKIWADWQVPPRGQSLEYHRGAATSPNHDSDYGSDPEHAGARICLWIVLPGDVPRRWAQASN